MIFSSEEQRRKAQDIDWQILSCRSRLIDVLARINTSVQINSGAIRHSDYYLDLKKAYKAELELLQNLQQMKKAIAEDPGAQTLFTEPYSNTDPTFISQQ